MVILQIILFVCVSLSRKHGTEVSLTHQQTAATKSNLITESLGSSTNEPYLTLPYPQFRLNKLLTTDEGKAFQVLTSIVLGIDYLNTEIRFALYITSEFSD